MVCEVSQVSSVFCTVCVGELYHNAKKLLRHGEAAGSLCKCVLSFSVHKLFYPEFLMTMSKSQANWLNGEDE